MALTPIKDRQNKDPKAALTAYIAIADAFNAAEAAGFDMAGPVYSSHHEFENGPYSIDWDSIAERWTLVAETDWAIPVCSFNQLAAECSEIDPCEQCHETREAAEDSDDASDSYFA